MARYYGDSNRSNAGAPVQYPFNPEDAKKVLSAIAMSDTGLRQTLKDAGFQFGERVVRKWIAEVPAFAEAYYRAKTVQSHHFFDRALEELDSVETYMDEHGVERVDAGMIKLASEKSKLLRTKAAILAPRLYGGREEESDSSRRQIEILLDQRTNKQKGLAMNKLLEDLATEKQDKQADKEVWDEDI